MKISITGRDTLGSNILITRMLQELKKVGKKPEVISLHTLMPLPTILSTIDKMPEFCILRVLDKTLLYPSIHVKESISDQEIQNKLLEKSDICINLTKTNGIHEARVLKNNFGKLELVNDIPDGLL